MLDELLEKIESYELDLVLSYDGYHHGYICLREDRSRPFVAEGITFVSRNRGTSSGVARELDELMREAGFL